MNALFAFLPYAAPLLAAASGEVLSERVGIVGIHTEGMILTSALTAVVIADRTGSAGIGLAAGVLAAIGVALLFALFNVRLRQDAVVVGTGVNLLALGITDAVFRAVYGETGRLLSVPKLPATTLLLLGTAIVALAFVLSRSRIGLAWRGCGEAPEAVRAAGFSVTRLRTAALLIAGAFAGFGGAFLSLGIAGSFAPGMSGGRGFMAIALVSFGRWNPWGVALAALFVGITEAGQYRLQSLGLPVQLPLMIPYVATLLVLILARNGDGAPRALGKPLDL